MKLSRLTTLVIVVLLVAVTVATGACSSKKANQPPKITTLLADPASVAPGGTSEVTCVASDPDGDALSYAWTCTGGAISGTGDVATWVAPSTAKTYIVKVGVSDGKGGVDNDSVTITVGLVSPSPTPTSGATATAIPTLTPTATAIPTASPSPTATPATGAINITSNPPWAKVIVDSVDTGKTTPCVINASAGNHSVKIVYPDYNWYFATVTVVAGETTALDCKLILAETKVVTLQPGASILPGEFEGKDAYVDANTPGSNQGSQTYAIMGSGMDGLKTRTYVQFDLSEIPSTAVIIFADLGLWYSAGNVPDLAMWVGAYQVTSDWDEFAITWNNQPTYSSEATGTAEAPYAATNNWVNWSISTMVQRWVSGSAANYGVMFRDTDESTFDGRKTFYTSEYSTGAKRPKLVITYYDPAP